MVKSSNEWSWLQNKRWSHIELSADGLLFWKLKGQTSAGEHIGISPLTFKKETRF